MPPAHLYAQWRGTAPPLKLNLKEARVSNGTVRVRDQVRELAAAHHIQACAGTLCPQPPADERLVREQLQFVEVFIRCRGKIKDVEEELGISYPTVVARLNEVVQAMGFEVRQEDADLAGRRQQILDELASGKLTAADAATRLRSL